MSAPASGVGPTGSSTVVGTAMEAVSRRIAPLWPLEDLVAVNPYLGLRHLPFWTADGMLRRVTGTGLTMPRSYYRDQRARGRITRADLAAAIEESGRPTDLPTLEGALASAGADPPPPRLLVTDVLGALERRDWSGFVVDRISRFCAAYFDQGQALCVMPLRDRPLYRSWLEYARIDRTPRVAGLRGAREALAELPAAAGDAVARILERLAVPEAAVEDYLHAALLSVGGWAGWIRSRDWRTDPGNGRDEAVQDLLAVRLAWEYLLYAGREHKTLAAFWHKTLAGTAGKARGEETVTPPIDGLLQTAFEIGYRREILASLTAGVLPRARPGRPPVQAVFCIDARSEIFRRALETVAPDIQTLGFAGFFGVPMAYQPLGAARAKDHLPVLFAPRYRISERPSGASDRRAERLIAARRRRMRLAGAWKTFKTSASSCFAFVETAGLLYVPKLLGDSLGWSRPVPRPETRGLGARAARSLGPTLDGIEEDGQGLSAGIPEADRPALAESVLRNMGLARDFARLVLFLGHGSATTNNPQGTGLDCGACGGHTGEASARIAAALLNDPATRRGLAARGIVIPGDTYFLAGLHNTTTDEVRLFETADTPPTHREDLARVRRWLASAAEAARGERAVGLGLSGRSRRAIVAEVRRRSRDWSEVRPEWGLARNAAFVAAPRARTVHRDLAGRVFLHEYDWREDRDFDTLRLIMTAPMVVAHWINLQYYGSTVDNRRFGSGNKVLHNVVGGAIGVLEGNGGDLRTGLALQSLHDGVHWIHEPVRLHVFVEAPRSALDEIATRDETVRELVGNAWLHLFQIGEDGRVRRRLTDGDWRDVGPETQARSDGSSPPA